MPPTPRGVPERGPDRTPDTRGRTSGRTSDRTSGRTSGLDARDQAAAIGDQLRRARAARGLSLSRLAASAGVGKGSLSEIEAGGRNPTLSTLYALANALDVPLAALLAERRDAELSSPGITARLLDTIHHDHLGDTVTAEIYDLVLVPGVPHHSHAHGPGVVEHFYLVSGTAEVGPAEGRQRLTSGQSATWAADVPHSYEALEAVARGVLTITTPGTAT